MLSLSPQTSTICACLLTSFSLLTRQSWGQSVNANIAGNTTSAGTLSPILSPSYAGMGIEPTNLIAFTGSNTVNELTYNLLNNLANYTGVPPHLRIGGNSGDNMLYSSDSQYSGYQVYTNPSPSGGGSTGAQTDEYIIGSGYFAALDMLPKGTPITYGLNMAYNESDFLQQIVNQANAAINGLSNVTVVGFEVGNEPDLYVQNNYRASGWTVDNYGAEWANRVETIYATLLQPKSLATNFFEPACTATTATTQGKPYRVSNLLTTDVATSNGIYVAGWNQHDYYYYVGVSTYTLTLDILMDLSQTTSQFTEWSGQAQQAKVTGKPYYLREMGSVGPEGLQGITNVFGNTLWTFNFFLYAATQQISSVQMHMTQTSYSAPWHPVTTQDGQRAGVRTTYYAWAAIDQIIGPSCQTTISPVQLSNIPNGYTGRLTAYASYQGANLATISMINTNPAYTGASMSSVTFTLSIPTLAGQTLHLSTLTASGADATTNTTWNGISFEETGNGKPTQVDSSDNTVVVGSDGTVSIPVRDSQAVVAAVGAQIGSSRTVDAAACASLSTQAEGGDTNASGTTASVAAPTFKATGGFQSSARLSYSFPGVVALTVPAILYGFLHFFK
ncbi:hypothetical protein CBS101457_001683 [Exobasidium rhododendri]|nr:hypothetical protein CBS101457_001683 [Exobasidium rhododendri]